MLRNGTKYLIAIHLIGEHGSAKKIFFYLLDLTILSKTDHGKYLMALVQNLLEISSGEPHSIQR
jgi:hypothetical protein